MSFGGNAGAGKIATSSDAALSNLNDGQILTYSSATQKWINAAASDAALRNGRAPAPAMLFFGSWSAGTAYDGGSVVVTNGAAYLSAVAVPARSSFTASDWIALGASGTAPPQSISQTLQPFAATSVWRLGIANSATFASDSDARNTAMSNVDANGSNNRQAWFNWNSYSHPIAFASSGDPSATVTDTTHTDPNGIPAGGSWTETIPANARIAAGTDAHMHVITTDSQYIQEHFGTTRNSATSYTVSRRHQVSLNGSGIGPQNGTRAYGGSAIGGLIRGWEVNPSHPDYTGKISHALAVALRNDQMLYTGSDPDAGYGDAYDAQGYGLKKGYVWPATEQDYLSYQNYSGSIPMGSYFAIPPSVDVTTLGLSTSQGLMLAHAAQDYGVYVTDTGGNAAFYAEDDNSSTTNAFVSAFFQSGSYNTPDIAAVFKALRAVTNNTANTPNGGTVGTARRA